MKPEPPNILPKDLSQAGERAAESLGVWINRNVRLEWQAPELLAIEQAGGMLGPFDAVVPACILEVHGPLTGRLVLVADAFTIASFVNSMMGLGNSVTQSQEELIKDQPFLFWDEMTKSAALETANIVACAYLNALATALPDSVSGQLVPSPPRFFLDYAGSLGEFLLIDLSNDSPGVVVTQSRMFVDDQISSDWRLVWIPRTDNLPSESTGDNP